MPKHIDSDNGTNTSMDIQDNTHINHTGHHHNMHKDSTNHSNTNTSNSNRTMGILLRAHRGTPTRLRRTPSSSMSNTPHQAHTDPHAIHTDNMGNHDSGQANLTHSTLLRLILQRTVDPMIITIVMVIVVIMIPVLLIVRTPTLSPITILTLRTPIVPHIPNVLGIPKLKTTITTIATVMFIRILVIVALVIVRCIYGIILRRIRHVISSECSAWSMRWQRTGTERAAGRLPHPFVSVARAIGMAERLGRVAPLTLAPRRTGVHLNRALDLRAEPRADPWVVVLRTAAVPRLSSYSVAAFSLEF